MATDIDFPTLVVRIRETRGLTQEQLARELGVTFGTVNGWENGKHQPSPLAARELLRIASESGIDADGDGDSTVRSNTGRRTRQSSKPQRKQQRRGRNR